MTAAPRLARLAAATGEAFPGLVVSVLLATAAFMLADQPLVRDTLRVSALLLVILAGMAVRSFVRLPESALPGIRVAQRPLLRWAVAGLGFRLSVGEIAHIGGPALAVVATTTFAGLGFGWWLARRLGLGDKLGLLLGVGGAICGASAVVAADSVVQAEKRDAALAIGVITLYGTLGIVLYPWIGRGLGMGDTLFGVWDGASLHEMAQVVAAGAGFSAAAVRIATTAKLIRISLLAPVVLGLAWWMRARAGAEAATPAGAAAAWPAAPGSALAPAPAPAARARVSVVPWFLVLFVVFAAVHSLDVMPAPLGDAIQRGDTWLLCVGMAGVGLQTGFSDLRRAGAAPILAGAGQWLFVSSLAYLLARALCR